jgi:hypothetical protein
LERAQLDGTARILDRFVEEEHLTGEAENAMYGARGVRGVGGAPEHVFVKIGTFADGRS